MVPLIMAPDNTGQNRKVFHLLFIPYLTIWIGIFGWVQPSIGRLTLHMLQNHGEVFMTLEMDNWVTGRVIPSTDHFGH